MGSKASYGHDRQLPSGRQALTFPANLAMDSLGQVCHGCAQTWVFPFLCEEASDFVEDPSRDAATQTPT